MNRSCVVSGQSFEIDPVDCAFYQALGVPPPRLSPIERLRRRLSYRNFRSLGYRSCSATGKRILSMYDDHSPFPVFDQDYWWSDAWDARSFAVDFNLAEAFFPQYRRFAERIPRYAISNILSENCHYSNLTLEAKDCYLVFGCVRNENCLYGHIVWDSSNCVDNLYAFRCEWCSNSVDILDCYDVHYSSESVDCSESYFLHDCRSCRNCFGGVNLRGKEYYFFNQPCSPEEYQRKLEQIKPLKSETVRGGMKWLEEQKQTVCFYPELFGFKNESVSGNHIYESKNVHDSFDIKRTEDCRYCFTIFGQDHCYDLAFSASPSRYCYESLTIAGCERVLFSHLVKDCQDVEYSEHCFSSHHLFGCHGLRNASYCIFNNQYGKEEYFRIRQRIVDQMIEAGEWGEFFPAKDSPFAYNESVAQEYLPLSREEVINRRWRWKEECQNASSQEMREGVLRCKETGKDFKVIEPEADFYRRLGLPFPDLSPACRHTQRMSMRVPRELRVCQCARCGVSLKSSQPSASAAQLFCLECYERCLYGT